MSVDHILILLWWFVVCIIYNNDRLYRLLPSMWKLRGWGGYVLFMLRKQYANIYIIYLHIFI